MPDSPDRGGVGNPHDERYFYENVRDFGQGDPRERQVIFDPLKDGCRQDVPPGVRDAIDLLLCKFQDALKKFVFISKRPAFVEPPFFSKPITKTKGMLLPPLNPTTILDRRIEDRQRAVVTAIGVDTDNPAIVQAQSIAWWFGLNAVDNRAAIINLFDDQTTPTHAIGGMTTILPGSVAEPYSFLRDGIAFQVKGPTNLIFAAQLAAIVVVNVRVLMTLYQYWLPHADAYASADLQL